MAIFVALSLPSLGAIMDFKTLPPSIGYAGNKLKAPINAFKAQNSIAKGIFITTNGTVIPASKKLTAGPARAIFLS